MIYVLLKEFFESIIRNSRKILCLGFPALNKQKILLNDGLYVESNFLSSAMCLRYIEKIEGFINSDNYSVWVDECGSDHRVYFVNTIDEEFNEFYKNIKIREILKAYTGTSDPVGMLLAAKIEYKEGNLGSGGGWHRDSPVTHQFKAVCYLNDVDEQNGPFQYIRGSHRKGNVIRNYFNKVFKPGQYRFTEDEISNYLAENNKKVESVTGKAGTLVYADTKGIHRGKPVEQGVRYVLFCYFWHDKIPEHFESLKQTR